MDARRARITRTLARALDADIFDFGAVLRSTLGRSVKRIGGRGAAHALMASTRLGMYDVVFSDNERVGVFAALILRSMSERPRHVMLGHHLSPIKKRPLLLAARAAVDLLIVHSQAQVRFAIEHLGFAAERVMVLPYQVDTNFWKSEDMPRLALTSLCRPRVPRLRDNGRGGKRLASRGENWGRQQLVAKAEPPSEHTAASECLRRLLQLSGAPRSLLTVEFRGRTDYSTLTFRRESR